MSSKAIAGGYEHDQRQQQQQQYQQQQLQQPKRREDSAVDVMLGANVGNRGFVRRGSEQQQQQQHAFNKNSHQRRVSFMMDSDGSESHASRPRSLSDAESRPSNSITSAIASAVSTSAASTVSTGSTATTSTAVATSKQNTKRTAPNPFSTTKADLAKLTLSSFAVRTLHLSESLVVSFPAPSPATSQLPQRGFLRRAATANPSSPLTAAAATSALYRAYSGNTLSALAGGETSDDASDSISTTTTSATTAATTATATATAAASVAALTAAMASFNPLGIFGRRGRQQLNFTANIVVHQLDDVALIRSGRFYVKWKFHGALIGDGSSHSSGKTQRQHLVDFGTHWDTPITRTVILTVANSGSGSELNGASGGGAFGAAHPSGVLQPSMVSFMVRQEPVDSAQVNNGTPFQKEFGSVSINLAEYVGLGVRTRRYLLKGSKMNATLRLTIELIHNPQPDEPPVLYRVPLMDTTSILPTVADLATRDLDSMPTVLPTLKQAAAIRPLHDGASDTSSSNNRYHSNNNSNNSGGASTRGGMFASGAGTPSLAALADASSSKLASLSIHNGSSHTAAGMLASPVVRSNRSVHSTGSSSTNLARQGAELSMHSRSHPLLPNGIALGGGFGIGSAGSGGSSPSVSSPSLALADVTPVIAPPKSHLLVMQEKADSVMHSIFQASRVPAGTR